jgi:hypothetical protein
VFCFRFSCLLSGHLDEVAYGDPVGISAPSEKTQGFLAEGTGGDWDVYKPIATIGEASMTMVWVESFPAVWAQTSIVCWPGLTNARRDGT